MSLKKLSLDEALDLEDEGLITIYDFVNSYEDTEYHPKARSWIDNYQKILFKFRQMETSKISTVLNCDYQISIELEAEPPYQKYWKLIYAKTSTDLNKLRAYRSKGQYVYVLVNPAYSFVKIGKAIDPLRRVRQINGAGVVSEWKLAYALPVSNDYVVENFVHRFLDGKRRSSEQGSLREYFDVSLEEAVDVIERLAEGFRTGMPIYY